MEEGLAQHGGVHRMWGTQPSLARGHDPSVKNPSFLLVAFLSILDLERSIRKDSSLSADVPLRG